MKNLLTLSLLSMLLTTCVSGFSASYNYNVAVKNIGKEDVWCSLVASAKGIAHEPGVLIPGKSKSVAGPFKHPYADKWTVTWKTSGGKEITKTLDLRDKLPKGFEGRLIFTIDAENNLGHITEKFSGK